MHLLDLNLDVVHTILSYVDRKDMLELAATCASLHEPVMRCYAAYINTGNFKKRGALHEYCDYILCDARRSRYLTSVVIPSWPEAPSEDNYGEAERFAQLICRTERLTSVKCGMFPYGSQAVPVLLDAIASVATLTSVELALNDDDMLRVLSSLKSDPYQIVCWFQSPGVGTCIPRLPFLDLLAAFPHLHTLELINASPFLFEYGTSDEAISLPSVRELTVVQSTPSDLHPVARVFPNVETLHLSRPSDMMEPQVSFAWPSVNYLSTNYAVPITSHVRHVSIVTSPRCSPSSIAMLHCLVPLVIECYIDREYLQALSLLPDWSLRALQLRIVASLNEGLRQYLVSTSLRPCLYRRLIPQYSMTTWRY